MAANKQLKRDTLEVLACSMERWLSLTKIKRNLERAFRRYRGLQTPRLEGSLDGQVEDKEVERRTGRGGPSYAIVVRPGIIVKRPPPVKVGQLVAGAVTPPSTGEMGKALGMESRKVYQICRRFEKRGFFKKGKQKQSERCVFFAPIIGQSVHSGNYELVRKLYQEPKKIVGKFSLDDARLEKHLRKFFAEALSRNEYAKYKVAMSSFREELIRTIRAAKAKSDVYEFLGLKPYYPKVGTWKSAI
jgi:hypothetical protein